MPDWDKANAALLAQRKLDRAGHLVTATDVPGLFDVQGIARDVTVGQLIDIASQLNASPQADARPTR